MDSKIVKWLCCRAKASDVNTLGIKTSAIRMVYECAYCNEITAPTGPVETKYGWAYTYECSTHGTYYVMDSPQYLRGQQIGPTSPIKELNV